MSLKIYSVVCCDACAESHKRNVLEGKMGPLTDGICEICNTWKQVAETLFSGNLAFTKSRDNCKIFNELIKVISEYVQNKDYERASQVTYHIDEVIHDELEQNGDCANGTAVVSRRKQRRASRKRS